MSAALALAVACQDMPKIIPCDTIPEGGCNATRGGTCEDPVCEALYRCIDGSWTQTATCEPSADAGVTHDASAEDAQLDAALCSDGPVFDGAVGCRPALQLPDCSLEVALGCAESACSTGCEDFFGCTDEGWELYAYCDTQAGLIWIEDP